MVYEPHPHTPEAQYQEILEKAMPENNARKQYQCTFRKLNVEDNSWFRATAVQSLFHLATYTEIITEPVRV